MIKTKWINIKCDSSGANDDLYAKGVHFPSAKLTSQQSASQPNAGVIYVVCCSQHKQLFYELNYTMEKHKNCREIFSIFITQNYIFYAIFNCSISCC